MSIVSTHYFQLFLLSTVLSSIFRESNMKSLITQSTKVYDGFSTCFRQWRAVDTHCKFLHGYGVSFRVTFQGELDEKNWVFDFGGMKRAVGNIDGMAPNVWLNWLLDHTVIIAEDDPGLAVFVEMHKMGLIQLRMLPAVGAERFAEYLFDKINEFIIAETDGRVQVVEVEFSEHGKNSALVKNIPAWPSLKQLPELPQALIENWDQSNNTGPVPASVSPSSFRNGKL